MSTKKEQRYFHQALAAATLDHYFSCQKLMSIESIRDIELENEKDQSRIKSVNRFLNEKAKSAIDDFNSEFEGKYKIIMVEGEE